ncbi:FHA domain protein [Mycobacterium kansasii]|uniref:FHA domain protein n=1 Tax=Mycobacterium kansasii TaxID=1768 RepID=A0A1V3Y034_MYCKA|nr:FHA domain protein [Mycobacterium kansasii]
MRITHPLISRAHLLLRFDQGRWLAIDNNSLNGTFCNGRRVPMVDIQDGQSVNIGNPDGPLLTFEVGRHVGMAGRPPQTESMRVGTQSSPWPPAATQVAGHPGPPPPARQSNWTAPPSARPHPGPPRNRGNRCTPARRPGSPGLHRGRRASHRTSRRTSRRIMHRPGRARRRPRRCSPAPPSRPRWPIWRPR